MEDIMEKVDDLNEAIDRVSAEMAGVHEAIDELAMELVDLELEEVDEDEQEEEEEEG